MIIRVALIAAAAITLAACVVTQPGNRANAVDDMGLAGSEWGPDNGIGQFVKFGANGELTGFAGCNSFFGTYKDSDGTLTIGPLASTKKMCRGTMGEEQAFMGALQNARRHVATHTVLQIFDAEDELILRLQRRDWD